MQKEFEANEKYKLFRNVRDLLHPSISKKNISNYKIIVDEHCLLLRCFYPKKVSHMEKVILYIPGEGSITGCEEKYSDISSNFSKELDQLVITIDYENQEESVENLYDKIYETISFIYKELRKESIKEENITIIGDSTGANIALNCIKKGKNEIKFGNMILFYPVLSGEYSKKTKYPSIIENTSVNYDLIEKLNKYYKNTKKEYFPLSIKEKILLPRTLILSGNVDPLVDEAKAFQEKEENVELKIIGFAYHGFLNTKDKEIIKEYWKYLKTFMKVENNEFL